MTSDHPPPPEADKNPKLARRAQERRGRKAGLWLLLSLPLAVGAGVFVLLSYLGTPITVPDWARERVTERINRDAGDLRVDLGEMVVTVQQGWRPELALRNVALRGTDGREIVTLSEVSGSLAMEPLLRGEIQPGVIHISGVQLTVQRRVGGLDVSVGAAAPFDAEQSAPGRAPENSGERTGEEAADLAALLRQMDEAVSQPAFAALTEVQADNLTLRYEDARSGRAWNVDGGQVMLSRRGDDLRLRGDFVLLAARAYATSLEVTFAKQIGAPSAEFSVNFADMPAEELALQSPSLAWLGALDAPISGALRAQINEEGLLGPLNATLQIGAGVLQPNAATTPIAFESASSYFTYDPSAHSMRFESLSIESKWVTARAQGTAFLVGAEAGGWPQELQAQMQVSDITANPADLYAAPIALDGAVLDMRLKLDPFHLSVGQLSLSDMGANLTLSAELRGEETGWDLALDGYMDRLDRDRLMALWPPAAVPNTRAWVETNVSAADLSNVQIAVRSLPKSRPDVFMGFDFRNMTTKFMRLLPPITGGVGHATLYDERFVIHAEAGVVQAPQGGQIDVAGTSFVVENTREKQPPSTTYLRTQSSITAALALLDAPPFEMLSKQGQPVTLAEGRADVAGTLSFLLKDNLQTEDVRFDLEATLRDVSSDVIMPGKVLRAERLRMTADNETLAVFGNGWLGEVPFTGRWESPVVADGGGSTLTGEVTLSETFSDEFSIGLAPGSITGSTPAQITVELQKGGGGGFTLRSDLAGLGLAIPQLGWSMSRAATGALSVEGRLGTPIAVDALSLTAPGLSALGAVSLQPGGGLERAVFSRVQVGDWLDVPAELVGRGLGETPAVRVTGGTIDLRRTSLNEGRDAGDKAGGPVSLMLERLQISDAISLTGFRAELDTSRGTDGTFSGRLNDGAPITGRVVPQDGRSAFRVRSQAAGGVLGSAGLLKGARSGDLELILTPAAGAGSYDGQLTVDDIWLTDAPALAALLSAVSVVGLLEQMSGNGILFNRVEAQFRLTPDRVTLLNSSAVGASMGISMDGYYFTEDKRMDMQGVVSPLYLVNALGGIFTRRGEGLVGFNYTLSGPASQPRVEVNPLSLLTPGMFRELFRRPAPTLPETAGVDGPPQAASGGSTLGAGAGNEPGNAAAPEGSPVINRNNR
ncbi:AsmA-like C-terminal region-containing protein [Roseovarius sp. LXJ103]|uniref:hypothetical protein n=1 Tax=Roseovarius carneus TaxID=2853164 RepID=UPI000D61202B|nr:hypothetical protein [Roseovarius carneus]MBZ8119030.1 AsmA-like C-terminal region-containing protein [Roseovarius carneus]PWE35321.1 hypothetical protein DD563_04690 [Pelagicola sp. LXJ1103]